MINIEFYYKSDDAKTEPMRKAIDTALFGTNLQCNFKKLPDYLIYEDKLLEKATAGKNITKYPTCIIYRDGVEHKRYSEIADWEDIRRDINYLTGDDPNAQTNKIYIFAYISPKDCVTRATCADAIYWVRKFRNLNVEYIQVSTDNDFRVEIVDPWRSYYIENNIEHLTVEKLTYILKQVPRTVKDATFNNATIV